MKIFIRTSYDSFENTRLFDNLKAAVKNLDGGGLENRINKILNGTGRLYYTNVRVGDEYIEFNTEEDGIAFLLKWA